MRKLLFVISLALVGCNPYVDHIKCIQPPIDEKGVSVTHYEGMTTISYPDGRVIKLTPGATCVTTTIAPAAEKQ